MSTITPDIFQVFAENSLIKNKFEEEKHLKEKHEFVLESTSVLRGRGGGRMKARTKLS